MDLNFYGPCLRQLNIGTLKVVKMPRNLLIIVRTCTRINMLHGAQRYINVPKNQLVNHCLSSLVNSINQVNGHEIKLIVLDDHSSEESIKDIKTILGHCSVPNEFISIEDGTGNGWSMHRVYQIVEEQATDLWYHVEDDYLHQPEAIQDIIDSIDQFETNTELMVAVNPHDDVYRYTSGQIYDSLILLGPYRHYRTVKHTTYTCVASRAIYDAYKNHFQDVVTLTTQRADWVENKSINHVWNKPDVMLFSPIPSLAWHISEESCRDPYIDVMPIYNAVPAFWESHE